MKRLILSFFLLVFFAAAYAKDGSLCICSTPGGFTINSSTSTATSITISWSSSSSSQGYNVYYKVNGAGAYSFATSTGGLSATVSGLSAAQSYDFMVVSTYTCINDLGAVCGSRETTAGNQPTYATTAPAVPGSLSNSSVTQTTFTANWGASGGASGYFLELYNGAILIFSGSTATISLAVSDPDISAGGTYSWRVRANGVNANSSFSAGTTVTMVPPAPSGLSASGHTTSSLTLNWSAATGASGYRLDVATNSSFSPMLAGFNDLSVSSTSRALASLSAGTTYYYRVRAENGSGTSGSTQANTITICAAPTANAAANISASEFKAQWQATTGAASYRLDVSVDDFASLLTNYNNLSVAATEQIVNGLSAGTTYKYRVRAVNASGTSTSSTPITVVTVPPTPTVTSANGITQTEFNARWNAATGATGYRLDVSTNNFSTFVVSDLAVTTTSKVVNGLTAGTTYQYRVRATNGAGTTANSDVGTVTLIPPTPTNLAASSTTQSAFQLQWTASNGATSYRVDVSDDNFTTLLTGFNNLSVTTTSVAVNSLTAGKEYQARVRAVSAGGASGSSTPISVITVPPDPTIAAAGSITQSSFVANWNAANSATQYRLDVSADNFSTYVQGFNDKVVATNQQLVDGLTPGLTYSYRVRAENASGVSANSGSANVAMVPATPVAKPASAIALNSFTANWDAAAGATDYRLDVSTDNFTSLLSGYSNLVVSGTSQAVNGLTENQTYQYRVRASNASGVSPNSNTTELVLNPTVATALPAIDVTTTSFRAKWSSVANALGYRLDVSTDNFVTRVDGYDDLSISTTEKLVTGLNSGATYQVRVRTVNNTGVSGNSNTVSVTLLPAAPALPSISQITTSSAVLTWLGINGATSYRLDVSTDQFATFVQGFENLAVNGVTKTIIGLQSGTSYSFRVRAENSTGVSSNSPAGTVLTLPSAPVFAAPSNVTANSFQISWSAITGADSYRLDVATNSTFTNFVQDFQNASLTQTSTQVTGLSAGLTYHVRVRAVNATGTSENSSSLQQVTIPAAPVNLVANDRQVDRFVITWSASAGATAYEAEVATDDQFVNRLAGFNPKEITTSELAVTGLVASTLYHIRVKAKNAAGTSTFSETKTVSTLSAGGAGGDTELKMDPPTFSPVFSSTNAAISLTVTGGVGPRQVTLHHRPITGIDFSSVAITYSPASNGFNVEPTWLDELGMEFYLLVSDGQTTLTSNRFYMKKAIDRVTLPIDAFGGSMKDYRIISLPYVTEAASLENLFEPIMGAYKASRWRLVRFQNNRNVDYGEGLSKTKMERGLGYWFNSKTSVEIVWSSLSAPDNNQSTPFEMTLKQGWNQIGNPFPFAIDWQKVRAYNSTLPVDVLLQYDPTAISLKEGNRLEVFSGGFTWADRDMVIKIPVTVKASSSGRTSDSAVSGEEDDAWFVNLKLTQGAMQNTLSGFGMRNEAEEGKDRFDLPVVPRFGEYLEWRTSNKTEAVSLSRSVVTSSDRYTWDFQLRFTANEPVTIQWNADELPQGQLLLEDLHDHKLIDMTQVQSYEFSGAERELRVHFDRNQNPVLPSELSLGVPFPNPAKSVVSFAYAFQSNGESKEAQLVVRSVAGAVVKQLTIKSEDEGLQKFTWHFTDGESIPAGLYLYELKVAGEREVRGKLVIE